jgi:HD superfamily phosphodiesterase
MSKTDEYRQFANDCFVWARRATSDDQREQFVELAKKWMRDAESIDQGIEPRPKEAAKASEMAAEEIDRLGDPLATDEERQLRKQRLMGSAESLGFAGIAGRRSSASAGGIASGRMGEL